MPLYFFYTMVQNVKNDQKLKSRGGPALNRDKTLIMAHSQLQSNIGERVVGKPAMVYDMHSL